MTQPPQREPQRCDNSCQYFGGQISRGLYSCTSDLNVSGTITGAERKVIRHIGCGISRPNAPAPATRAELIAKTNAESLKAMIDEQCKEAARAATLAENKRVLDDLHAKTNQRQIDVETEEGDIFEAIEKGEVIAWIESLRITGDQKDIAYLKDQISNCKPALKEPEWENTDEYLCRCDATRNYYEKKSDLKYRFGIDFEGDP